jgi:hypothetical protein
MKMENWGMLLVGMFLVLAIVGFAGQGSAEVNINT